MACYSNYLTFVKLYRNNRPMVFDTAQMVRGLLQMCPSLICSLPVLFSFYVSVIDWWFFPESIHHMNRLTTSSMQHFVSFRDMTDITIEIVLPFLPIDSSSLQIVNVERFVLVYFLSSAVWAFDMFRLELYALFFPCLGTPSTLCQSLACFDKMWWCCQCSSLSLL